MQASFSKKFDKQFQKLNHKQQLAAKSVVNTFLVNNNSPKLRKHALKGKWQKHYSISAGGDLRIHYRLVSSKRALFVAVGSHSQLYR